MVSAVVACTCAAAVVAFSYAWSTAGPPSSLSWFGWLLLLTLLVSLGPPQVIGRIQLSYSSIFMIAAVPLLGPIGTAVIAMAPVLFARNEAIKRAYNVAMRTLFCLAGSAAYALSGGTTLTDGPLDGSESMLLAARMALASVVIALTNNVLLAFIVRVSDGVRLRPTMARLLRTAAPGDVIYFVAAFLLVILWAPAGLGVFAALLALPCFLVAEWALRQYVGEYDQRQQIIESFASALDSRVPGSGLHGARVAAVAEQLAVTLGMRSGDVEDVKQAATLRDITLLAAPGDASAAGVTAAPRPSGALAGIDFLRRTRAVMDVGERGFVRRSTDVGPSAAQVIDVADAYVRLVAPRGRRPALPPEDGLRVCASQTDDLDPQVVRALAMVIDRGLTLPEASSIVAPAQRAAPVSASATVPR